MYWSLEKMKDQIASFTKAVIRIKLKIKEEKFLFNKRKEKKRKERKELPLFIWAKKCC